MIRFLSILNLIILSSGLSMAQLDVQGHRGAKGLMPENTMAAFKYAAKLGVTTLEMDLHVSKDNKIVVSHDPTLSAKNCFDPDGNKLDADNPVVIYETKYRNIKKYNCTAGYSGEEIIEFEPIPLLKDVIKKINKNYPDIRYNIEVKSGRSGDRNLHPEVTEFCDLLHKILKRYPADKFIIQSFDVRALNYLRKVYPRYRIAYLVGSGDMEDNLEKLDILPDVYSPHYSVVDEQTIEYFHSKSIRVIPWTVNDENEMRRLIKVGVDGIITDFPDRLLHLVDTQSTD